MYFGLYVVSPKHEFSLLRSLILRTSYDYSYMVNFGAKRRLHVDLKELKVHQSGCIIMLLAREINFLGAHTKYVCTPSSTLNRFLKASNLGESVIADIQGHLRSYIQPPVYLLFRKNIVYTHT